MPTRLPVRQIFKIYTPDGNFMGVLQGVSSIVSKSVEINSAGSQISFNVARNMDTARLPVEPIQAQDGSNLETESGEVITTEGAEPTVGDNSRLIVNGNILKIFESNTDNPNGYLVFSGYISTWTANIGSDDDITVEANSDGQDLDQYLTMVSRSVDTSITTGSNTYAVYGTRGVSYIYTYFNNNAHQSNAGATKKNVVSIDLYLAAQHATTPVTVTVYLIEVVGTNEPISSFRSPSRAVRTATRVITGNTPQMYSFDFVTAHAYQNNRQYGIFIGASSATSGNGIVVYYRTGSTTMNGLMLLWSNSTDATFLGGAGDGANLRSILYYAPDETLVTFTNMEISTILKAIMDRYLESGGLIHYSPTSIESTGVNVTLEFQVATVLEAIKTLISLAPANFYWYVDDFNVLHFKAAGSTPDHIFIKGRHLEELVLKASIRSVKNIAYVTGGKPTNSDPNVFVKYEDTASIAKYRRGLERISNYQIISSNVALTAAQAYVEFNKGQKYETTVVIPVSEYNIAAIDIGHMVSLAGFLDSFVEKLMLQVVRMTKTSSEARLIIGTIPDRQTIQIDNLARQLTQVQTVDNPNEAS